MNKLTSIRIKQNDGTYSDDIPIQVLAENVSWILGSSISLLDILGDVKYTTKGSIQHQLDTFSLDEVENARVGADDTQYQNLKARLDGEYEDLQDAIAAVATNLQTQTGARSNADAAIRTDLSSETTARINGDNLLSSQIATEVNARKAAINSEVTARNSAINSAIATEVTNRNNAISSAIATEITDRNNAISSAIATEVNNRNEAIATEVNNRNEAISTEASTRATTNASIRSQINHLVAPSGEAPSAAEVQNARIGADGITYSTLGDAIRNQNIDISDSVNKSRVLYDYSTTLTNVGYMNQSALIITGKDPWRYSDQITIPTDAKTDHRNLYVKARLQSSSSVQVPGRVFYQGTVVIRRHFIDHDTVSGGETCYLLVDIPSEATSFRLCSYAPSYNAYFAYIIAAKKIVSDDSAHTITSGVSINALSYVSTQNGYLNTYGTFVSSANNGWTTSDFIDVTAYNAVRVYLKGASVTSVLALYDREKTFIRGVQGNGSGTVLVSGDYDIGDASYFRFCFFNVSDDAEAPVCTIYNRSKVERSIIQHTINKPYVFDQKRALFCGDSITAGYTSGTTTTENSFPKLFSDAVGLTYTNKGAAAATIARFNTYRCIHDQIIGTYNINDYDYILIAGGVNDWQLGVSLTQFREALETLCSWLSSNYTKEAIFILPIDEAGYNLVSSPVADLDDYRNFIKEVALKYEISIVNGGLFNFPTKGSSPWYISQMFGDKLHPSEKGHRLYAKMLRTVLL